MKKVAVLGAGLVGSFIAKELAKNYAVTVYDYVNFVTGVPSIRCNLKNESRVKNAIKDKDLVVNALPGSMGFNTLQTCINAEKNVVDISFMPEDFTLLDNLAKEKKVTAVVDFGFAPGISHVIVGNDLSYLGKNLKKCVIYVGGLPKDEKDEYKAVFSPRDIVEEYTRPARYKKAKKILEEEPFECCYTAPNNIPAFCSDGLRSLLNLPIDTIVEFTLRYQKHFNKMRYLKEDGFFKPENIEQTAKVLADKWKMCYNDRDISYLEVHSYSSDGYCHITKITDEYDEKTNTHSMARMTGLPAVFMATQILEGNYGKKGIIVPEDVGRSNKMVEGLFSHLKDNNIEVQIK
jgi:saccharopine dehydrogenase-like NADP-dependent oxidoreductase